MSETGAIGAATTAVLAAADADVSCGQDPRASYAFCAPKKAGGDFYIGIVPNDLRPPSNDLPFIKGLFGTPACRPEPAAAGASRAGAAELSGAAPSIPTRITRARAMAAAASAQ